MNRITIKLFSCFIIIFSHVWIAQYEAWAEEDVFCHPLRSQTSSIFNETCLNLAKTPIIKGKFTLEKYLYRFDRSLISSGDFIISAEQGMVWETLQPFPSTMILGKDFIFQSRPDGRKSVLSAQGNETFTQMADVISSVFTGKSQGLLENFEVYFNGSISSWNMGLLPRDSIFSSFVTKITMSGGSAIQSIRLFEKSSDIITYTLSNHIYPAGLNDYEKAFFAIP